MRDTAKGAALPEWRQTQIAVRFRPGQRDLIQAAAKALGETESEFIRRSAVSAAASVVPWRDDAQAVRARIEHEARATA
jgi:uncharacterized protein (DUF1778 family)